MDMVEILREQVRQLGAAKTELEKEALLDELKTFLIALPPERQFEHLKAIKTLLTEIGEQIKADRASKLTE